MRGAENLIALRRRGWMPSDVWVFDGMEGRPSQFEREIPALNEIEVSAAETPALLDLRCLVGVPVVHVSTFDATRAARLSAACIEAGARRVLASVHDRRTMCVTDLTDSAGGI